MRYNALTLDRLNAKYGLYVSSKLGINTVAGIELKVAQFFQGTHYEGLYGAFYNLKLNRASKATNLRNEKMLSAGFYFRSTGALIPTCYMDLGACQFGVSYDQELGKLSRAYRSSLEFSFSYTLTKRSIFAGKKL